MAQLLSTLLRTRPRPGLCTDPQWQGRGRGGSDSSHLATLGLGPRSQGRELASDCGRAPTHGHICLKFDPTDTSGTSVKYSPLEQVRLRSVHEAEDVQN